MWDWFERFANSLWRHSCKVFFFSVRQALELFYMKKEKKKKDQQWNGEHYKIKVGFFQNHLKLYITCSMLFTRSVLVFSFWLNDKVSTMLLICISCVGYHSEVYHSHVSKGIWFHGVSILWMVLLTAVETAFSTCFGDWEACNARKKLAFIEVIKVLRYWMVGIFKWNTYASDMWNFTWDLEPLTHLLQVSTFPQSVSLHFFHL